MTSQGKLDVTPICVLVGGRSGRDVRLVFIMGRVGQLPESVPCAPPTRPSPLGFIPNTELHQLWIYQDMDMVPQDHRKGRCQV